MLDLKCNAGIVVSEKFALSLPCAFRSSATAANTHRIAKSIPEYDLFGFGPAIRFGYSVFIRQARCVIQLICMYLCLCRKNRGAGFLARGSLLSYIYIYICDASHPILSSSLPSHVLPAHRPSDPRPPPGPALCARFLHKPERCIQPGVIHPSLPRLTPLLARRRPHLPCWLSRSLRGRPRA